ncbi:MAG: NAD(P)H-binding protein [Methanobacterium sp.]|uniref:NAD(P)-dependent oxidoreductase n=2 Tax=Methanobacterium sp. TaxID=2164 RepID=UPI003C78385E
MKITIFGATGNIGKLLVKQAIDEGHEVVAYVRDPSKIANYKYQNLSIVKGQLNEYKKIEYAIDGADAVMSMLGPAMTGKLVGMPISEGTQNIVNAMEKLGVKRLIAIATPSVSDPNDIPTIKIKLIKVFAKISMHHAYSEILNVGDIIQKSDLEWTIIRYLQPTNDNKKGKIRHGFVGRTNLGMKVTRADIADFSLKQLTDRTYIRKMPAISN